METAVIYEPQTEEKELQTQALSLKEQAQLISITDETSYLQAGQFAKNIKDHKAKIVAYFKPLKEAAHKAHKSITQREAEELEPLNIADAMVRGVINAYLNEQERLRKEAQAKAEAEATEKARKEQEKLLQRAANAEVKGDTEKAEALFEKAENVYIEPVIVPSEIQKTTKLDSGSITRKTEIKVTVTDPFLFIKAIAEKKAPITVVEFKPATLKSWVKSAGIKNGDISGLRIEEISGISIR